MQQIWGISKWLFYTLFIPTYEKWIITNFLIKNKKHLSFKIKRENLRETHGYWQMCSVQLLRRIHNRCWLWWRCRTSHTRLVVMLGPRWHSTRTRIHSWLSCRNLFAHVMSRIRRYRLQSSLKTILLKKQEIL